MITCFLRYVIDPDKLADFEQYARTWMNLIERFGGTHHGYFVPEETPASAAFSFPGIGEEGPKNVAIALFTFPTIEAYDAYRNSGVAFYLPAPARSAVEAITSVANLQGLPQ